MITGSLHVTLKGHVNQRGYNTTAIDVELDWTALDPAVLVITAAKQPWEVSRSLFIAAGTAVMAGAWVGGGEIAVCIRGDVCSIMLRPRHPSPVLITIPASALIGFLDHSRQIIDTHSIEERDAIERLVDEAIGRCLS